MKRKFTFCCTIVATLATCATLMAADAALGKVEGAKKLIGKAIHNAQGDKLGELKDVVLDLESGRVLYTVATVDRDSIAIPANAFSSSSESRLTLQADKAKLAEAPRFTDHAKLDDTDFAKRAHEHFGKALGWEGTFNNVHRASKLMGTDVKNASGEKLGDVRNLGIDLQSSRVTYVMLGGGGIPGAGEKVYALPPNALTLASDGKSLVAGIDRATLEGAPQVTDETRISDAAFAARVYQHFGKQPYWDAKLAPTGREEGRAAPDVNRRDRDRDRDRISRDRDDDDGLRVRRGDRAQNRPAAAGDFANIEEARRLIGMNIENANGGQVGKLNDMVVDLESGRVIYATVNPRGKTGPVAVAPAALRLAADDKSLRFVGDESRLENAPAFDRNADLANAQFADRVYKHFGQEHPWFEASGKFGHVHRASEVMNMKVENTQNQGLGQVQNLMVDIQKGRVLYVILGAAPVLGRGEHLLAMPPNAFTMGDDRKTLVTDADKAKLEAAPRFTRANLRELANPTRAAEIYRYYGKQAYWSTDRDLAPTGRERGQNN
jgi:sporulation protein YlmC with PRC-barrel domain